MWKRIQGVVYMPNISTIIYTTNFCEKMIFLDFLNRGNYNYNHTHTFLSLLTSDNKSTVLQRIIYAHVLLRLDLPQVWFPK